MGSTDSELLERFAGRDDGEAFEILVGRHEAMVRRACLDLLGNPVDADDACQATFLKLFRRAGSIRSRDSLASWLHRVAVRAARRVRSESTRRRAFEARAGAVRAAQRADDLGPPEALDRDERRRVLHEELDRLPGRYRLPLILCGLEGLTQAEAASRLGWSEGSVRGRLARGKARLRARLTRRGLAPSSVALAVEELGRASGASGAGLKAGAISLPQAPVAAWTWAKAVALLIALGATLAVAALTHSPSKVTPSPLMVPPPPVPVPIPEGEPTPGRVAFRVRVVDPRGEAVPGARVYSIANVWVGPEPEGVAADGSIRFERPESHFARNFVQGTYDPGRTSARIFATAEGFGMGWKVLEPTTRGGKEAMKPEYDLTIRLVEDSAVSGRIVGPDGRPVAGAIVSLGSVETLASGDFASVVEGVRKLDPARYWSWQPDNDRWIGPDHLGEARDFPPVTTGPDGRYRFTGIGRDRKVGFSVSGPGIGNRTWTSLTREGLDEATRAIRVRYPRFTGHPSTKPARSEPEVPLYGPTAEVDVTPERTIAGVVRDARTGLPVAGLTIHVQTEGVGTYDSQAVTDPEGRYRVVRLDLGDRVTVRALAAEGKPHLGAARELTKVEGVGEATADFALGTGVVVTGRVLEAGTGLPMPGRDSDDCPSGFLRAGFIHYLPLLGNPRVVDTELGRYYASFLPHWGVGEHVATIDKDGFYRAVVPPGPGVLLVRPYLSSSMAMNVSRWTEANGYHLRYRYAPLLRRIPDDGAARAIGGDESTLPGALGPIPLRGFITYRVIDPAPVAEARDVAITIPKAPTRRVRLVSPTGEPVRGTSVTGLVDGRPVTLEGDGFEAQALDTISPRECFARSADGMLTARFSLKGDPAEPVTIAMEPATTLAGRLVDPSGRPIADAEGKFEFVDADHPEVVDWETVSRVPLPPPPWTDAEGRFLVRGLFPGFRVKIAFVEPGKKPADKTVALDPIADALARLDKEIHYDAAPAKGVMLKPGENRDLGDVKASPWKR